LCYPMRFVTPKEPRQVESLLLMTFGIETLGIMTFGIETLGIMTFGIMTFGIEILGQRQNH
jgi:hypothetical protein